MVNVEDYIMSNCDCKIDLKPALISAVMKKAEGELQAHKANIEVYLANPVGIGEHSNIIEAIETELKGMAKAEEIINLLDNYF